MLPALSLSYKVGFLVAITSARRVSELRALTSEPPYTVFPKDKVQLGFHPAFLLKVVSQFHINQDIFLSVFYLKPHSSSRGLKDSVIACPQSAGLLHRENKTVLKVYPFIRCSGGQNERSSCLLSTYLAMAHIMHSGVLQLGKGACSFNHSALHQGSGLLSGIPGAGSHPGNLQNSNMVHCTHFHKALCDYPAGQSRCSLWTSSAPVSGRH